MPYINATCRGASLQHVLEVVLVVAQHDWRYLPLSIYQAH